MNTVLLVRLNRLEVGDRFPSASVLDFARGLHIAMVGRWHAQLSEIDRVPDIVLWCIFL